MFYISRCLRSGLIILRQIAGPGGKIDGAALAVNEIAIPVLGFVGVRDDRLLRVGLPVDARLLAGEVPRCFRCHVQYHWSILLTGLTRAGTVRSLTRPAKRRQPDRNWLAEGLRRL